MALPVSFENLLRGNVVESERIEFKETWDPEASLKTICAFANDLHNWGGGYLVIGVEDNNGIYTPKGIPPESLDRFQKDLLEKCHLIQPDYMPVVSPEIHDGKHFLVVWAPGGSTRPYSSPRHIGKNQKAERVYWVRGASCTVKPSQDMLRELFGQANQIPFDDRVNPEAEIGDLSPALVQNFLREVGSDLYNNFNSISFVDLCQNMQIISSQPEYRKPRNVGLMFFSLQPEKFFPYAQIDVVEFMDETGTDFHELVFRGPLHQQLRDALRYIRNTCLIEYVKKADDTAEARRFYNFPYAAVEEALSNAVYHKGYDVREPIEVRIEPDRMIIISHPGADRSISQRDLQNYRAYNRSYRNRRVGEFLKELHLTEGRNTGFRKIRSAMEKNGSPPPLFDTDEARTYFTTTLMIHPEAYKKSTPAAVQPKTKRPEPELSPAEIEFRDYALKHPSVTNQQAIQDLGISRSTLYRTVEKLKEKGILRVEGKTRNRRWVIEQDSVLTGQSPKD